MKEFVHNALDFASWVVSWLYAPVLNRAPDKTDYPERAKAEVFSNKADDVISKPVATSDKLVAVSKRKELEKEFWETL